MPLKTLGKAQSEILQADSLTSLPWLIHGFSTRPGGLSRPYGGKSLNLGFTCEDSRRAVEQNRAGIFSAAWVLSARDASGRWLHCARSTLILFIVFLRSPKPLSPVTV